MRDNPPAPGTHLLSDSRSTNLSDRSNQVDSHSGNQREEKTITPKNVGAEIVKESLLQQAGNINQRVSGCL